MMVDFMAKWICGNAAFYFSARFERFVLCTIKLLLRWGRSGTSDRICGRKMCKNEREMQKQCNDTKTVKRRQPIKKKIALENILVCSYFITARSDVLSEMCIRV